MAECYQGRYSPGSDKGSGLAPAEGRRVVAAGFRSNLLFVPAVLVVLAHLSAGPERLVTSIAAGVALMLGAWFLREGLRAEAAFHDRKVARRRGKLQETGGPSARHAGFGKGACHRHGRSYRDSNRRVMAKRGRHGTSFAVLAAAASLAACQITPVSAPAPEPEPVISAESAVLAAYYQRLQDRLLAQGLIRTDGGGPDTPFTDQMLAQNFVRIALFDEYVAHGGTLRAQTTISRLRRWEQPIRMSIEFGTSIPTAQRTKDSAAIVDYAGRLSAVTGVPIHQSAFQPNYVVLVLNELDRQGFEIRLRELLPGIDQTSIRTVIDLPKDQLCIVIGTFGADGLSYDKAVALIRGEHPDLLRLSCIHEELAQGMGLANDSPRARPSIFNDDEEFGLLTTQDELMLQMLYDPRLTPGMTAAEAAPIARIIAKELMAKETDI